MSASSGPTAVDDTIEVAASIAPLAVDQLQMPCALYGRDAPILRLSQAYERVAAQGRSELVMVEGGSGIGKSSLVNDLRRSRSMQGSVAPAFSQPQPQPQP
ncbi:MAG: Signal transduction histidine kinase CheA, partial [Rhizobacter sp.]|nr:Signal transduction histidine kinase CheA [Rhizobacter sp.]